MKLHRRNVNIKFKINIMCINENFFYSINEKFDGAF